MRNPSRRAAFLGVLLLGVTAGCGSDDSPTAPTPVVTLQDADDVAVQSVTAIMVFGDDLGTAVGSTPMFPSATSPARASWDTTFTTGAGLSYTATRAFYDGADNELSDFGPTAARMHWMSRASGLLVSTKDSATVGHATDVDFRGIQPSQDTLRIDGTCRDTLLNKFRSLDGTRTRILHWISSYTITNVRFLKSELSSGPGPRPLGGTITFAVSIDRLRTYARGDIESHFDATVIVFFNGTAGAGLVVNGTFTYYWNLDTGEIVRAIAVP